MFCKASPVARITSSEVGSGTSSIELDELPLEIPSFPFRRIGFFCGDVSSESRITTSLIFAFFRQALRSEEEEESMDSVRLLRSPRRSLAVTGALFVDLLLLIRKAGGLIGGVGLLIVSNADLTSDVDNFFWSNKKSLFFTTVRLRWDATVFLYLSE
jgi:hypothetical protein